MTLSRSAGAAEALPGLVIPGNGALPGNKEAPPVDESNPKEVVKEQQKLMAPEAKKLELTLPSKARVADDPQAAANVDKAIAATGSKAKRLLAGPIAGQGKGGPGRGGGQGTGTGTGKGDGSGPGQGTGRSIREERASRVRLSFPHFGPSDYVDKLIGLGAFLAAENPHGEFIIYRDLVSRPVKGKVEDILSLDRHPWTPDPDSPHAVSPQQLARVLGITPVPSTFLLLLPRELDDELLAKELAAYGRKEEEIAETVFQLVRRGKRYEFVVISQTAK